MTHRIEALRIEVRGVVQGVGFRPTVYRLALESGVAGWVLNDRKGIAVHAEGEPTGLGAFVAALRDYPPPAPTRRLRGGARTARGPRRFHDPLQPARR